MRISDWSSDVCSSDLNLGVRQRASSNKAFQRAVLQLAGQLRKAPGLSSSAQLDELAKAETLRRAMRSEEHTSELQSLMRISYAVFCLKKKKHTTTTQYTAITTLTLKTKEPNNKSQRSKN